MDKNQFKRKREQILGNMDDILASMGRVRKTHQEASKEREMSERESAAWDLLFQSYDLFEIYIEANVDFKQFLKFGGLLN